MKATSNKKSVGSYPFVNVIFSISTALFMIGLFFLLVIIARNISSDLKKGIEIQVFLRKGLNEEEIKVIEKGLSEKSYIDQSDGKPRIQFLSKEDAAKTLIEDTGEDFIEFLGANPLRDSYIINLTEDFQNNERLEEIKKDIESIPDIYEVAYTQNLKKMVDDINDNIQILGMVISVFVIILLFTVVVLINNAIKLALFSQRFLIRSMQLVGATPFFIKKPFVLRATLHGAISGFLATLLLLGIYLLAIEILPDIEQFLKLWEISLIFIGLLALGSIIGYLSSYSAVTRYLRMRLDELY
ncbi:cell division protein FtsX [Chondrinema litorale]|uniref:cell division protein FtsX n=1 Tax=Chondrinema litorale TaxID=2994555 RepID=UPI00254289D7|nr:permease-like cell division protein FtsX [Chondrinema litorale]UZR94662.1 permease-like cell division protein FtsX [Chondrinema litorale]